ncbi:hypothetical protein MWU75_19545 [Ornithinimicrobium sp. F0845]|uniref:hypothetical protein n=1 Tax=Ornithinimicrobium sp. F0845 TaxID=2926412 RepID=UPI001FF4581A|nr:hypothetical protein [Ornithinimicrobium sp. F0845]MCK0114336.1 hypothetical protein [Ornithinimicrobium sp. F0845]
MTANTLLLELVTARGLQPEPIATQGLVHILQTSPAARKAITGLANGILPTANLEELVYSGQAVSSAQEGRPDIVGADTEGARLVIEAKFDAALTGPQAGAGYLKWLSSGQPSLLLYLVPKNRVVSIWPRLLAGPAGIPDAPLPDSSSEDQPWLVHGLADGNAVAVVSWESLLARLEAVVVEPPQLSDLTQLASLVRAHLRTGWAPLAHGDLPDRAGQQLAGLRQCVIDAALRVSPSKTRSGSSDAGPGRWLAVNDKAVLWAGLRIGTWGRLGRSPLWAMVWSKDPVEVHALREALAPLSSDGPGVFALDGRTWGVPLYAPVGAEQGETTDALAEQLKVILDLLHSVPVDAMAPGEEMPLELTDGEL